MQWFLLSGKKVIASSCKKTALACTMLISAVSASSAFAVPLDKNRH
jgi:hypothetical protein